MEEQKISVNDKEIKSAVEPIVRLVFLVTI